MNSFPFKALESQFGIRYLHSLTYANWKVEQDVKRLCAMAKKKGNIGNLALWLGKLYKRKLEDFYMPDIEIQFVSPEKGHGVFTKQFIKKWDYIGEYTGVVKRRRILFPNLNDYCFMYPREWFSRKLFTIDSEKEGNFTRFINHSDYPNMESVALYKDGEFHLIFRAIEDIFPGRELTYDYGDVYWKKRKKIVEKNP